MLASGDSSMAEAPRESIESLAQQSKSYVQHMADMVNKGIDAGADLQPEEFNVLATRAISCADEITRLARQLHPINR